jgi:hypothetical protein
LRRRSAPTYFQWVKGHNGEEGNEESDKLARAGAKKQTPNEINLSIPTQFQVKGAHLSDISQSLAYKGLEALRLKTTRATSTRNLEIIHSNIKELMGQEESNESIWGSTRIKILRLRISQFLFRAIHGAFKIGKFWSNMMIPERMMCQICDEEESMTHILTECRSPARIMIWDQAKELWLHQDNTWPPINFSTTIGCGLLKINWNPDTNQCKTQSRGATRLLRILMAEASYLTWTMRCERVIQGKTHMNTEAKAAWIKVINKRLNLNKITVTKIVRKKKLINLVKDTWELALKKQNKDLPQNWITRNEFF